MVNLNEILHAYPTSLWVHRQFILKEYLQYKILSILFESDFSQKFCFLGGTCIRIVHNSQRFSEDLDFDHFGINENHFKEVSSIIQKGLENEGYKVEIRQVLKSAFHCYIKFPGLLFAHGLSGFKEEKILIQLDTEPQNFDFKPQVHLLNKFDVITKIFVTPPDLLLAQKFTALCERKRTKGRDFYDISFLLSKSIKPNFEYLSIRLNTDSPEKLIQRIENLIRNVDLKEMANDVRPFLINPEDEKRILYFPEILTNASLS